MVTFIKLLLEQTVVLCLFLHEEDRNENLRCLASKQWSQDLSHNSLIPDGYILYWNMGKDYQTLRTDSNTHRLCL
jgi:hypothetical protein